jgi:hypothetical protein
MPRATPLDELVCRTLSLPQEAEKELRK